MTEPLFLFCSMASFYLIGTLVFCGYIATEKGPLLRLGKGFWLLAFLLHSLFLTMAMLQSGRLPTGDPFGASTFFAWAVVLAAYLSTLRYRIRLLGAFVLPLVFFLILLASFQVHQRFSWAGTFSTFYFGLHTVFLFLSYAAFALGFVTGLMYLILERQIKWKRLGRFYRGLPSLELLEKANSRFVALGVIGYSLGLLFGLVWSFAALGHWVGSDPKVIFAFLTWGLYGTLFLGRRFHRIYGRKSMMFSVLCFLWVIVTFIGVQHPTVFAVLNTP